VRWLQLQWNAQNAGGRKKKPRMMGGARKENDADADDDVDDG
jgi:hypothetical protein